MSDARALTLKKSVTKKSSQNRTSTSLRFAPPEALNCRVGTSKSKQPNGRGSWVLPAAKDRRMRQVDGSVGRSVGFVLGVMAIVPLAGAAGCGQERPESGSATLQALTVPVPLVTQFAVLASRTASVGDRSQVIGGDLGVAAGATNSLTTGFDSVVGVGRSLAGPGHDLARSNGRRGDPRQHDQRRHRRGHGTAFGVRRSAGSAGHRRVHRGHHRRQRERRSNRNRWRRENTARSPSTER